MSSQPFPSRSRNVLKTTRSFEEFWSLRPGPPPVRSPNVTVTVSPSASDAPERRNPMALRVSNDAQGPHGVAGSNRAAGFELRTVMYPCSAGLAVCRPAGRPRPIAIPPPGTIGIRPTVYVWLIVTVSPAPNGPLEESSSVPSASGLSSLIWNSRVNCAMMRDIRSIGSWAPPAGSRRRLRLAFAASCGKPPGTGPTVRE